MEPFPACAAGRPSITGMAVPICPGMGVGAGRLGILQPRL